MLPVAVWVDVGVAAAVAGRVTAASDTRGGVMLDDEVVPVGDPKMPIRADLGDDGREPFIRTGDKAVPVFRGITGAGRGHVIRAQQVAGRGTNEGGAVTVFFRERRRSGECVAAAGGVGVERVHLPDVRGDRVKRARIGDHLGAHLSFAAEHSRRDAAEKRRVVVGGRAEDIPGGVEAKPPGVVVELVQKLDVRGVRLEAKHAHAEVVLLATE